MHCAAIQRVRMSYQGHATGHGKVLGIGQIQCAFEQTRGAGDDQGLGVTIHVKSLSARRFFRPPNVDR